MNPYVKKGIVSGMALSIFVALVTIVSCDRSCSESPVYLVIPIYAVGFIVLGAIIGGIWRFRMLRIITVTIISFALAVFLVLFLYEMAG
jgi:prepilin signal peptidase PulO-like enzyme (type II secretory pathway)